MNSEKAGERAKARGANPTDFTATSRALRFFLVLSVLLAVASLAFGQSVTFTRNVAPIVFSRCGICHHPGGPAPFSLLTYADVRRHARRSRR